MSTTDIPSLEEALRELEKQAIKLHTQAQTLNKAGKYEEAQIVYAKMHAKENEATALAQTMGCASCLIGEGESSACQLPTPESEALFTILHPIPPLDSSRFKPNAIPLPSRVTGAIVGGLLGDAAAMGVHWIYDMQLMAELEAARASSVGQVMGPSSFGLEFMDPPRSPFYTYESGRNSPYGEQTLVLLESLAHRGGMNAEDYADLFFQTFGDDGFDGYKDVSTKGFLRRYGAGLKPPATGAPDAQANCVARLGPLVAAFACDPKLMTIVDVATRVTQNADDAIQWGCTGASILEHALLGSSVRESIVQTIQELEDFNGRLHHLDTDGTVRNALRTVLDLAPLSVPEAVQKLGRNCHMPGALQTPLLVALHVESLLGGFVPGESAKGMAFVSGQASKIEVLAFAGSSVPCISVEESNNDRKKEPRKEVGESVSTKLTRPSIGRAEFQRAYVMALRLAIREGGCCSSRASYLGSLLAAVMGDACLPEEWQAKYAAAEKVRQWADSIVACRMRGEQ